MEEKGRRRGREKLERDCKVWTCSHRQDEIQKHETNKRRGYRRDIRSSKAGELHVASKLNLNFTEQALTWRSGQCHEVSSPFLSLGAWPGSFKKKKKALIPWLPRGCWPPAELTPSQLVHLLC